MAKLLPRFRRKALQVAPEPSENSGHLPKGQSHLSVPAGGEAASIPTRRRKFPAFWKTKPAPSAGAELGEAPTKPRWSWLRKRFGRQDPAQEGRRAGRLWGLLCGHQRPQEPSPHSEQGASPCLGTEDLSAPSDQEREDPSTSTSSSARDSSSAWGSSSSDADGRYCFVPGTPTDSAEEEWLEMTTEEAALKVIREQLQCREQDERQQLRFLQAIYPACLAAQDRGQDTLEPHCCKVAVVERIVELIEEFPKDSPPSAILSNCLAAVGNLSTMKPALEPDLESHLLKAALGSVFTLGTEMNTIDIQALHKVMPEFLDAMLGNLLAESPDSDRLHFILEHVNLWIMSRVPRERARAIKSSTALLSYAVTLPEFDISAEFPRLGHHVAQLALFVSDPDQDISRPAREGTYRLYQLLLEQRGLTIHEEEDLWCHDWRQDSRLLGYKNTARVGEVFGRLFSAGQRKYFLETAMPAIHHPLLGISQAGLLLTYAILGEAEQLLGYTLEDVTAKLMSQLRSIRQLHQVPEVLQGLSLI